MQTTIHRRSPGGRSGQPRRAPSGGAPHRRSFQGGAKPRSFGAPKRGGRKMPTFDPSQFINTNPAVVAEAAYVPTHRFDGFGLDERIVRTIAAMGIDIPTPIQDQIIPKIMEGRDVIGLAETGTGKTAAFLLPLIEKTLKDPQRQTLILAPTRELAIQIETELKQLARGLRIYSTVCVGGINIRPQINALRRMNHFVIGTPGRVLDLLKRKDFNPRSVTTVVLDEADRMLDMGFINDMKTILSSVPAQRETLFFSATMDNATKQLVNDFLRDPVTISVKKSDVTNSIAQDVVAYSYHSKFETLAGLLSQPGFQRVIIFCSMKHGAERLANDLTRHGVKAESIHGNKNHSQRQRALTAFKTGAVQALVATDVAARGIHVDDVSHVINYDLPNTFEDYVHRIGRTGRGSKRGKALTFVQEHAAQSAYAPAR